MVSITLRLPWTHLGSMGLRKATLRRQQEGQETHASARLLNLLVVLTNPGANDLALVPGSIVPDQKPMRLALREQTLTAPVQELRGDGTHRSSTDRTQPHLLTPGLLWGSLLPQHAIAGQRFGIRVSLLEGLFDEADGMLLVLPGVHARQGKAAPPDLILEADGPGRLLARPGDQSVTSVFFSRYCGWGREEPSCSTVNPVALKSLITLRTVWSSQPS